MSAPRTDHYSYSVYADPGDGRGVRRAAVQRADRAADRRDAGARARRRSSRRVKGRTVLDVGTGTGRAAIALARARRARHRRRRVGGDARRGAAQGGRSARRRSRSLRATRTVSAFDDQSFDAVVCLRVLMHTPDWRQSLARAVPRRRNRVVFDYPALASAAALQALTRRVAAAARRAASRRTASSRSGRARDAS